MSLTAHISKTRDGAAIAELRDGERIIAKMYANEAETKIRVVFDELTSYAQTLISPGTRCIEFDRKVKQR